MKKTTLLMMIVMLFSLSLHAQDSTARSPEARAQKTVEKIGEEMNLEDQQKKSLVTIMTDFYTDMQQYRSSGDREMMKKTSKTRNDRVKEVLNESQFEQYEKLMAEMRKQRAGHRGNDRSGNRHRRNS